MARANLAGLGTRLIAIIIDNVILWVIGVIIGNIIGGEILGVGIGFLVGLIYNWYFWTQNNGQTPGKSVLGIRVVKTNGKRISDLEAIVRYIGYYINSFLLLLGWLWAVVDDENQGLHDKLAGTVVVKA